jgi:ABC-type multidrug transport system ATPase subunit
VLFLDEPTTGLDLTSRNELWDMIRELVGDGTTVLLTTQYLEEADQLAGRIAVIDGGHVIANDSPGRLKADLGDTVVEMGFADEALAERAAGLLGGDGGAVGKVERERRTVRVSSNLGARVLVEVLRRFDGDGVEPDTLSVREPSLDDVFLALTGHRAENEPAEAGDAA